MQFACTVVGGKRLKKIPHGRRESKEAETYGAIKAPPMEPTRKVNDQECSKPVVSDRGNIRCN